MKVDGSECNEVAVQDGGVEGAARFRSYVFLIHLCFCEARLAEEGEKPAPNPCAQQ